MVPSFSSAFPRRSCLTLPQQLGQHRQGQVAVQRRIGQFDLDPQLFFDDIDDASRGHPVVGAEVDAAAHRNRLLECGDDPFHHPNRPAPG